MSDPSSLRVALSDLLDEVHRWFVDDAALSGLIDSSTRHDLAVDEVVRLRTRGASTLINIAFVGAFSSGKSFLINALQRQLAFIPVEVQGGRRQNKYVGLLPSAPSPTSACPASVVPIAAPSDGEGAAVLRVRFEDDDNWYEATDPPPSVIAAYATKDPVLVQQGRRSEHVHRQVQSVELLLPQAPIPAKLYDLPGFGSPEHGHDEVMQVAIAEADCFVYVAHATRTLGDDELDRIERLFSAANAVEKPVIWVLAAIDRAADLDMNDQPQWRSTLQLNNEYLRATLGESPARTAFIGEGFVGVSCALEAEAEFEARQGNQATADELLRESRMEILRDRIQALIRTHSGYRHLLRVATEARSLLVGRERLLASALDAARIPLDELAREQQVVDEELRETETAIPAVRTGIESVVSAELRRVGSAFDGLAQYLHSDLDGAIRGSRVDLATEATRLELRRTELIRTWVERHGPAAAAARMSDAVSSTATSLLQRHLNRTLAPREVKAAIPDFDPQDVHAPPLAVRQPSPDLVQRVLGTVSVSTPVVTGLATLLGISGAALMLAPAAVVTAVAGATAAVRSHGYKQTALDALRSEWITGIDATAAEVREVFVGACAGANMAVMDRANELLIERQERLLQRRRIVSGRATNPGTAEDRAKVDLLSAHVERGKELLDRLDALSSRVTTAL